MIKEAWQTSQPYNPVHRICVSREGLAVSDQDEKKLFVDVRGVEKIEDASDNNLTHAIALAVIRDVQKGLLDLRTLVSTDSFVTTIPRPLTFDAATIYHVGMGIIDKSEGLSLQQSFGRVRSTLSAARIARMSGRDSRKQPRSGLII